jgi:hypothetical protein
MTHTILGTYEPKSPLERHFLSALWYGGSALGSAAAVLFYGGAAVCAGLGWGFQKLGGWVGPAAQPSAKQ